MTQHDVKINAVMILNFRTHLPGQTVQTQIRLLREQSDQGLQSTLFAIRSASFGLITLW